MLGRRIRARVPAIQHIRDLANALVEEFDQLAQAEIRHLIEGMGRRMATVMQARGGNSRY